MPAGIGGAGIVGIAHEVTPGTYVAPAQYLPVRNESVGFMNEVIYTRPIMGVVDPVHAVEGPQRVEGSIEFEAIEDLFAFMMYGARATVAKSGVGPYTYTFTPAATAEHANKTLSITVDRNGEAFGYTGCVVGGWTLSVDNGLLVCSMDILGRGEATQTSPTPTWPTTPPFGADAYTIEIPNGTPVTDADTFEISINDNAEAVYRLGNAQAAAFVKYGEREQTVSIERDFIDRTDYDTFKSVTAQEIQIIATAGANSIDFTMRSAIKSSYEVGLSGQGDLVRAQIEYEGNYDFAATEAWELVVVTDLDIT